MVRWLGREVRGNLAAKLSEAAPLFEEFLRAAPVQIHQPTPHDRERARELADAKDVPILAAAIGAGARILCDADRSAAGRLSYSWVRARLTIRSVRQTQGDSRSWSCPFVGLVFRPFIAAMRS